MGKTLSFVSDCWPMHSFTTSVSLNCDKMPRFSLANCRNIHLFKIYPSAVTCWLHDFYSNTGAALRFSPVVLLSAVLLETYLLFLC